MDGLREAYVAALVTAWKQAHWIAARVPNENGVAIVSNIEQAFKPFIPDWREASAEAARLAPLDEPSTLASPVAHEGPTPRDCPECLRLHG